MASSLCIDNMRLSQLNKSYKQYATDLDLVGSLKLDA